MPRPRKPKKSAQPHDSSANTDAASTLRDRARAVLWTKAEIAALLGVSRAALTKPTQPDAELAPAMVGARIDVTHPSFQTWAAQRGCDVTLLRLTRDPGSFISELDSADIALATVPEMTIAQACKVFGSIPGLQGYLRLRRDMIETATKEHQLAVRKGEQINREFVKQHVLGLIDAQNRRLLTDHCKTGALRADSLSKAGAPIEEIEAALRDSVSTALKYARNKSRRLLHKSSHAQGSNSNGTDEKTV